MNSTARDRWISGLRTLFARGPQSYLSPGSEAIRFARINFSDAEDQWTVARTMADALVFLDSQYRVLSGAGLARVRADGTYFISDHLAGRVFDIWSKCPSPNRHPLVALQIVDEYREIQVQSDRPRVQEAAS